MKLKINIDNRAPDLSKYAVFFDFDNTITTFDVLDDFIKRFARDDNWMAAERAWIKGEIGSRECLTRQLRSVKVTKENLLRYLSRVKPDKHFYKLLGLLKEKGVNPVILSDSFSFMIKNILRQNGIKGIKVYSNRLRFDKNRLTPFFPYANRSCLKCANCKKNHLSKNGARNKLIMYIGDGLSDVCVAENADMVFAKETLLKHCRKNNLNCVPFRHLGDIYRYFKKNKG